MKSLKEVLRDVADEKKPELPELSGSMQNLKTETEVIINYFPMLTNYKVKECFQTKFTRRPAPRHIHLEHQAVNYKGIKL
jgi:hypothetical protein